MIRGAANTDLKDDCEEILSLLVQDVDEIKPNVKAKLPKSPKYAPPPAKFQFLDGVRGLAALLVVVQHSHEYMQDLNLGASASINLLAQGASYRRWAYTLADYFSKRFFRVYPLFALVSIVLWILPDDAKKRYYLIEQPENFDLFKVLTFDVDQRYFVLWTLPLEIGYYFIIPFFVLVVLKLHNFWWVPFVPAYVWVGHEGWNEYRWDHMPLSPHFPTFLAGSMAAIIFVKLEAWIKTNGYEVNGHFLFGIRTVEFVALSLVLSLSFRGFLFNWVHENIAPQTGGFSFISVLLTAVLVIEMFLPSLVSSILEWSVLRYCGKVSFSIYLLHGFIIYAESFSSQQNYYDRMATRFGLTLALATVSYHLVEYPSQLLAQYFTRQLAMRETQGSTGTVSSVA